MSGVEVGEDCLFINHFLEINKEILLNIPGFLSAALTSSWDETRVDRHLFTSNPAPGHIHYLCPVLLQIFEEI